MDSNLLSGAVTVATAAAREAGNIILQNITQLDRIKVNVKAKTQNREELVSEIDLMAEQLIVSELQSNFPEHNIIGKESDYCWVIDPLDGTHNFLHGHPHCVFEYQKTVA